MSSPENRSTLLTYLDVLLAYGTDDPPFLKQKSDDLIIQGFLFNGGKKFVEACLEKMCVDLTEENGMLFLEKKGRKISRTEVEELVKYVENGLNKIDLFDYPKIVKDYFKKAQDELFEFQKKTNYILDHEKLGRLKCLEIQIDRDFVNNELNEWNFAAGSIGEMYFPNPNKFSSKHKSFWVEVTNQPKRIIRDFYYRSCFVPFHEIIHCFQGHKWKFKMNLWQGEFEASVNHLNFFYLSCRKHKEMKLFYEVFLWLRSLVRRIHKRIRSGNEMHHLKMYESWRNSYGKISPYEKDSGDIPGYINSYFKLRLPLESFSGGIAEKKILTFLEFHWKKELTEITDWISGKAVPEILLSWKNCV